MITNTEDIISLRVASSILGLHHITLRNYLKDGKAMIPFIKIGRLYRLKRKDVEEYWEKNSRENKLQAQKKSQPN
jgi:excisionase family DNA binding protein